MTAQQKDKSRGLTAEALREKELREKTYRERALKLFPWVCGLCGREFAGKKVRELTVHHKDHNHDNNPPDGSNWELLCLYCHDNEHARYLDGEATASPADAGKSDRQVTHKALAGLEALLKQKS